MGNLIPPLVSKTIPGIKLFEQFSAKLKDTRDSKMLLWASRGLEEMLAVACLTENRAVEMRIVDELGRVSNTS